MRTVEFYGDVLTSTAELIMHQVNCQGVMGSGVAKSIKDKWPRVYKKYADACANNEAKLGNVLIVDVDNNYGGKRVANLFTQNEYGYDGKRYTSYDALDIAFNKLKEYCNTHGINKVAMPWHMSCERGGANWDVVMALLKSIFDDTLITFEIWKL